MKPLVVGLLALTATLEVRSQAPTSSEALWSKKPSLLPRTCKLEDYPAGARQRNAQGTTRVRATITIDGEVKNVEVIATSGHEDLDAATTRLFKSCRGTPGEKDGKATEGTIEASYIWKLE